MTVETLKASILAKVLRDDHVTFAELERMPGAKGDLSMSKLNTSTNARIFFWANISDDFLDAIRELEAEKRIAAVITTMMTYAIDGAVPCMPVPTIKQLKAKSSKEREFWIPLVFRPFERVTEENRIPLFLREIKPAA